MEYDRFGSRVAGRFALFVAHINGNYTARVSAGQNINSVGDFRNDGYQEVINLQNDVRALMGEYEATLVYGYVTDSDSAFMQYLTAIASQVINALVIKLGAGGVLREADLFNRPTGSLGAILARRAVITRTTARDSAGRAWEAEKLVQTIARDFAYQAYIAHSLWTLQRAGDVHVNVIHADPTRNTTITVKDALERRAEIFHPNSSARMSRHHVSS
jgi:hypothetical protein